MTSLLRRLSFLKPSPPPVMMTWTRGIRVVVRDDNLDQALAVMQRKMQSSGMERLIKRHADNTRHLKNSEKRVLARKSLQMRIRSQELARRLQTILVKKIRGL
ncbi:uncharacterized protein LOC109834395 [Asparagus officinalis]|uniref:uncharacterized protein LOC109834395 n=1 Tax=Asparagus officinalis TaxID=4686 RepID=UPI00098E004C|nr:uncharacterized protein LOC109834395 [Asparagus officinalis]